MCRTTIVNDAWARGQDLKVHGWVYGVHDGRVRDLGMTIGEPGVLDSTWERCVRDVSAARARATADDLVAADAADAARLDGVSDASMCRRLSKASSRS